MAFENRGIARGRRVEIPFSAGVIDISAALIANAACRVVTTPSNDDSSSTPERDPISDHIAASTDYPTDVEVLFDNVVAEQIEQFPMDQPDTPSMH